MREGEREREGGWMESEMGEGKREGGREGERWVRERERGREGE